MPRSALITLSALLLVAAALGLAVGLRLAGLDEGKLIDRVGRDWVAAGGEVEDCVARPGTGRVWIVVTCGAGQEAVIRAFDRFGFVVEPGSGPDA